MSASVTPGPAAAFALGATGAEDFVATGSLGGALEVGGGGGGGGMREGGGGGGGGGAAAAAVALPDVAIDEDAL